MRMTSQPENDATSTVAWSFGLVLTRAGLVLGRAIKQRTSRPVGDKSYQFLHPTPSPSSTPPVSSRALLLLLLAAFLAAGIAAAAAGGRRQRALADRDPLLRRPVLAYLATIYA